MKRNVLAVLAAAIWVNVSEFVRNQLLFSDHWVTHYRSVGLTFPSTPVNGAVWGLWGVSYAVVLFVLTRVLSWPRAAALGWFVGFAMMWQVLWNLLVLPLTLMPFAIPLSLVESFGAAYLAALVAPPDPRQPDAEPPQARRSRLHAPGEDAPQHPVGE